MVKRRTVYKIPPKRENIRFEVESKPDYPDHKEEYKFMFRESKGMYQLIDPEGNVMHRYSRYKIDTMADVDYEAFLRSMETEIADDWYYGKQYR